METLCSRESLCRLAEFPDFQEEEWWLDDGSALNTMHGGSVGPGTTRFGFDLPWQ
jgi:hypothetical protein